MASSRVDLILDALKTACDAAAATLEDVVVKDGPDLNLTNDQDIIWVGHDGAQDDTGTESVRTTQEWVGIGTNNRRDEQVDVTCSVLSWLGDQDNNLARSRVYEIEAAIEAQIDADRTLGVGTQGTPGSVRNALISESNLFQTNNAGGARSRLVFTVSCTARL